MSKSRFDLGMAQKGLRRWWDRSSRVSLALSHAVGGRQRRGPIQSRRRLWPCGERRHAREILEPTRTTQRVKQPGQDSIVSRSDRWKVAPTLLQREAQATTILRRRSFEATRRVEDLMGVE